MEKVKEDKDRNIITMKNVTDFHYEWVAKRAKRLGTNMTAVVKMLIDEKIEKESKNETD